MAATQAQHISSLWQGTNEVLQSDFHYSQAWIYQGHGKERKTPKSVPFPSPDDPDATTQGNSLGQLAFLLLTMFVVFHSGKERTFCTLLPVHADTVSQLEPEG